MAQPAATPNKGMHFCSSHARLRSSGDGVSALARLASSRLQCFQGVSSVSTTSRQHPSLASVPDLGQFSPGAGARVRRADDLNRGFAINKHWRPASSSFIPTRAKVWLDNFKWEISIGSMIWWHLDAVVLPFRPSLEFPFLLVAFIPWLRAFLSMTLWDPSAAIYPNAGCRLEHAGPGI